MADRLVLVSGGTHGRALISDAQRVSNTSRSEPNGRALANSRGRSAHVEAEEIRGSPRRLDPCRFVVCVRIFLRGRTRTCPGRPGRSDMPEEAAWARGRGYSARSSSCSAKSECLRAGLSNPRVRTRWRKGIHSASLLPASRWVLPLTPSCVNAHRAAWFLDLSGGGKNLCWCAAGGCAVCGTSPRLRRQWAALQVGLREPILVDRCPVE